jgi:deazaflavin-dependent oxidoreductase (nitroreductase family)
LLKFINLLHGSVLRLTGGRIGSTAAGMKVVSLTTIGRKTGTRRTVLLTSPVQLGDTYVIVASRGGDDTHPAWFVNLRDDPNVEVALGNGTATPWVARVATADDRARLWPRVVAKYPHYGDYQRRTKREIPLVLLTPRARGNSGGGE